MYNVLIIGAGSIGALKPYKFDNPETENILTHAHAVYNNHDCTLVGIVDKNKIKAIRAMKKWNATSYSDSIHFNVLYNSRMNIDIAIIATPTETHYEVFKEVIEKIKPKVIILEKPVGNCEDIINYLGEKTFKKSNIIIDYIRRFSSATDKIKNKLQEANTIYNIVIRYTRGIRHEACHAIDLICYLLDIESELELDINILNGLELADRSEDDKSITVHMSHNRCRNILFLPSDGRDHCIFEIDIHTDVGRMTLQNNGNLYRFTKVVDEEIYGNYKSLNSNHFTVEKTDLNIALYNLVDHAINVLNGEHSKCNLNDAWLVHKILERIEK